MAQPFDLKTFIELQKKYVSDLAGIYTSSNADSTNASNAINMLGSKLTDLDTALDNSNVDTNSLLLKQQIVNNILATEAERLDTKKSNIDAAISGQQRLIQLNDTYRKRYSAYIRLILTVVLALIIIIALIFVNKVFPFIPEIVYTLLYIIILSGSAIYCWIIISDINKRDKFDYDKHTRPAPASAEELKKNAEKAAKAGDLLASIDSTLGCRSEGCCSAGTKWDSKLNKCIPDTTTGTTTTGTTTTGTTTTGTTTTGTTTTGTTTTGTTTTGTTTTGTTRTGFTTLNQAYSQEYELNKSTQPYTPTEFESYSKI
jgi:hypothetical protein